MVYQEVEPGTLLITANHLRALERQSETDHEKRIDAEVRALIAEERVKEAGQKIARADAIVRLQVAVNHEINNEMKWKRRFCILCGSVAFVLGFVGLLVIRHWDEISWWFR